jgi:Ca2+-transporting ATPase
VEKDADAIPGRDAAIGDRRWMAFSGTHVVGGGGRGVVVETGPGTVLGRIASELSAADSATPLQRELRALTARLGFIAVVVAGGVFGLTLLRTGLASRSVEESFLAAVALAVAAVPEGLATVVTVALALGVRRMADRGVIIRRLLAVETLGATTVILTDKTGTLTQNRMQVAAIAIAGSPPRAPNALPTLVPAGLRRSRCCVTTDRSGQRSLAIRWTFRSGKPSSPSRTIGCDPSFQGSQRFPSIRSGGA